MFLLRTTRNQAAVIGHANTHQPESPSQASHPRPRLRGCLCRLPRQSRPEWVTSHCQVLTLPLPTRSCSAHSLRETCPQCLHSTTFTDDRAKAHRRARWGVTKPSRTWRKRTNDPHLSDDPDGRLSQSLTTNQRSAPRTVPATARSPLTLESSAHRTPDGDFRPRKPKSPGWKSSKPPRGLASEVTLE